MRIVIHSLITITKEDTIKTNMLEPASIFPFLKIQYGFSKTTKIYNQ